MNKSVIIFHTFFTHYFIFQSLNITLEHNFLLYYVRLAQTSENRMELKKMWKDISTWTFFSNRRGSRQLNYFPSCRSNILIHVVGQTVGARMRLPRLAS